MSNLTVTTILNQGGKYMSDDTLEAQFQLQLEPTTSGGSARPSMDEPGFNLGFGIRAGHLNSNSQPTNRSSFDLGVFTRTASSLSNFVTSRDSSEMYNQNNKSDGTVNVSKIKLLIGFAQIVGLVNLDHSMIKVDEVEAKLNKFDQLKLGLDGRSQPFYLSPPKVLICDVNLESTVPITFNFQQLLDASLPSSYRGKSIKIIYQLVLSLQINAAGTEPRLVKLPLTIFSKRSNDKFDLYSCVADTPKSKPVVLPEINAIVAENDADFIKQALECLSLDPNFEPAMQSPTINFDFPNKPHKFSVSQEEYDLGNLYLTKSAYRPGDIINVLLEVNAPFLKIFQLSVMLESIEDVSERFANLTPTKIEAMTRQIIAQQQMATTNLKRCLIETIIPSSTAPAFATMQVALRYQLRFQFSLVKCTEPLFVIGKVDKYRDFKVAALPNHMTLETLNCCVPINIVKMRLDNETAAVTKVKLRIS